MRRRFPNKHRIKLVIHTKNNELSFSQFFYFQFEVFFLNKKEKTEMNCSSAERIKLFVFAFIRGLTAHPVNGKIAHCVNWT